MDFSRMREHKSNGKSVLKACSWVMICGSILVSGCALTQKTLDLSSSALLRPEVSDLNSAKAMRTQGMKLAAQEKDQKAIEKFEEAQKLAPELEGVAHQLAVLYDRNSDWEAARREYQKALSESPRDADLLNDYGYFLYSQNEIHDSEKQLRKCLKVDPDHNKAFVNLGLVLAAQEDYEGAFSAFKSAVGTAAAHQNLGLLQAQKGQTELAIVSLQKAVQHDPTLKLSEKLIAQLNENPQPGTYSVIQQASY